MSNSDKTGDDVQGAHKHSSPDDSDQKASLLKKETDTQVLTEGEIGGPKGLEPTRYGDWEKRGRCIDF